MPPRPYCPCSSRAFFLPLAIVLYTPPPPRPPLVLCPLRIPAPPFLWLPSVRALNITMHSSIFFHFFLKQVKQWYGYLTVITLQSEYYNTWYTYIPLHNMVSSSSPARSLAHVLLPSCPYIFWATDQEVREGTGGKRLHLLAHLRAAVARLLPVQRHQKRQLHLPLGRASSRRREADMAGRRRLSRGLEGGRDGVPVHRREHAGA